MFEYIIITCSQKKFEYIMIICSQKKMFEYIMIICSKINPDSNNSHGNRDGKAL